MWTGPCGETLLSQEICIGAGHVSEKAIKERYLCGFGIGIHQFFFHLFRLVAFVKPALSLITVLEQEKPAEVSVISRAQGRG